MQATVELSIYPLQEDYKKRVVAFIDTLKSYDDITVEANGMSTQLFGEYDRIMNIVRDEYREILDEEHAMLVMKVGKGILRYQD